MNFSPSYQRLRGNATISVTRHQCVQTRGLREPVARTLWDIARVSFGTCLCETVRVNHIVQISPVACPGGHTYCVLGTITTQTSTSISSTTAKSSTSITPPPITTTSTSITNTTSSAPFQPQQTGIVADCKCKIYIINPIKFEQRLTQK